MAGGAPRIYDRDAIALQLLEWAMKEDSINLCGFCAGIKLPPSMLIRFSKEEDSEICKAYEIAKSMIGERRERMLSNNQLHVKAYDLNAKTYDAFLKDECRDEKTFDSELASKAHASASDLEAVKMDAMLAQMRSMQAESALNRASINSNAETKSQ